MAYILRGNAIFEEINFVWSPCLVRIITNFMGFAPPYYTSGRHYPSRPSLHLCAVSNESIAHLIEHVRAFTSL